jgi:crotonobetainyl-CoA:carnitine CoA-transferase CaiB-like acyl-CoA transferase
VFSVLESIRVLELTEALAGPYCAMLLGDLGADVVKVERVGRGDQSRTWGPPFVAGESAYFLAANRNKRSLTLDFDAPAGREILFKLLETADVFLINQPQLASLERRGLDPVALRARFPKLIYCSISGYGLTGPKAGLPGYDIIAQAEAGLMSFTGEPGGEPIRYPIAIADMTCGIYAAMGILAALMAREKTGEGQFLDMALFDSQLTWLINIGSNRLNVGQEPERWGNAHPSIVPYQLFRGADGRHFVVGVGTEALWRRFVRVLDAESTLGEDARFRSNAERIRHRDALIPAIEAVLAKQPAEHWLAQLKQADIPTALVHTVGEALNDVQTRARHLIVELEHPALGVVRSIANPIRLSGTPVVYRLPPPLLGEHTAEILRGLGYADEAMVSARESRAI